MADVREVVLAQATANVAVTTTTETVAVSSGPVKTPFQTHQIVILAWGQLTTGTGTTTVTPRIRRGTAITGALVGEANAETVKAAAGGTEPFVIMVAEERADQESVEYSLTLAQAAATADGTILQASILVLVL